jgi:hypothetical protein
MTTIIDGTAGITFPVTAGSASAVQASSGRVLQVVQGTTTAQVSTTSSSFVTTSFSASITPSSSTSKILAMVTAVGYTNTTGQQSYFTLYRNATNLNSVGFVDMLSSSGQLLSNQSFQYLDSPSTTSSTTYTLYFKTDAGTVYLNVNPQISSITLMEIAA